MAAGEGRLPVAECDKPRSRDTAAAGQLHARTLVRPSGTPWLDATRTQGLESVHGRCGAGVLRFLAALPAAGRVARANRPSAAGGTRSGVTITRNWARRRPTAPLFPSRPDRFRPAAGSAPCAGGPELPVALGLIEGWHAEPGKRPVQIRVEGKPPRGRPGQRAGQSTRRSCCSLRLRTPTATARWRSPCRCRRRDGTRS